MDELRQVIVDSSVNILKATNGDASLTTATLITIAAIVGKKLEEQGGITTLQEEVEKQLG